MTNEELLDLLVGRKIVRISRMTPHTAEEAGLDAGYMHIPLEIVLEGSEKHGSIKLFALSDPDGETRKDRILFGIRCLSVSISTPRKS